MKVLTDELEGASCAMSDEEKTMATIGGLDDKVFDRKLVQCVQGQQVASQQSNNLIMNDGAFYHDFSQSPINLNGFSEDIKGRCRGFGRRRDRVLCQLCVNLVIL